jgi:hypothetical protein
MESWVGSGIDIAGGMCGLLLRGDGQRQEKGRESPQRMARREEAPRREEMDPASPPA